MFIMKRRFICRSCRDFMSSLMKPWSTPATLLSRKELQHRCYKYEQERAYLPHGILPGELVAATNRPFIDQCARA